MDLTAAQADQEGLDKDPETLAQIQLLRQRVLEEAAQKKFMKGVEPTDAELHAEYDADVAALDKTEYHARHILVKTKEEADQVIKKLKGGAKFEDLAKQYSLDPSKSNGGDLGWFTTARMVKPFGDAVKELKKGEYTQQPVQTQFGWHVIQLEDTRAVTPPPFDQVKAQIANSIKMKKWQAYVDELEKKAKIEKKLT
jgi:peptidyl-prolyl cis-trans isomerase C